MFLTRLGMNGKMIITGDITQIDLPHSQQSGLIHSMNILRNIKGIGTVEFNKKDIVRHKLVQRIVEAYEKETAAKEKRIVAKKNNEDLNSDEGDDVTNYEMNK